MVEPWFPTPIYFGEVRNKNLDAIQADFQKVFDNLNSTNKFSPFPREGCHKISDRSFKNNLIVEQGLSLFQQEVDYHVSQYFLGMGVALADNSFSNYKITASWMTTTEKNQYAVVHGHGGFDISGVYYFKTNGEDGDLFFEDPNRFIKNSICFEHIPSRWKTTPKVGKIVLFPSWLEHGTYPNTTDNLRISISFNIAFQRYGDLE
jgi:uncharacterized protein (TIGR02466 family)